MRIQFQCNKALYLTVLFLTPTREVAFYFPSLPHSNAQSKNIFSRLKMFPNRLQEKIQNKMKQKANLQQQALGQSQGRSSSAFGTHRLKSRQAPECPLVAERCFISPAHGFGTAIREPGAETASIFLHSFS